MSETILESIPQETTVVTDPIIAPATETVTQAPIEIPAQVEKPAETILGKTNEETPTQTTPEAAENKAENKPGEKAEGVQETEGSKSDEPAPLPTYDAFVRPDGTQIENDDLIKTLGQFETSTKDHAEVQKLGQSLIDLHHSALSKILESAEKTRLENLEKQKNDWKEAFIADPEIGGNKQNTTVSAALEFIRTHGGTKEQQKEFQSMLDSSGLGNHPAMIRMLANASRGLQEGKPLPATRPAMTVTSKVVKRYGTN